MIIDTTRTKIEQDFRIADIMEQLRLIVNNPNLTINCSCGKICCLEGHGVEQSMKAEVKYVLSDVRK